MSAAAPLTFPGGRAVAGWWRQLAPYQPQCLWVAQLLLHRVEALVQVRQGEPVDPYFVPILTLLDRKAAVTPAELAAALFLDAAQARQALQDLVRRGWAAASGPEWSATEQGRAVCRAVQETGRPERRSFYFMDGATAGSHHYLRLGTPSRQPASVGADWHFDPRQLAACIRQPADWKSCHGFPEDVTAHIEPTSESDRKSHSAGEWPCLVIDYPERLSVVLVVTERNGVEQCLGFEFQQQGWHLHSAVPAFALGRCWRETFPELTRPVPLESWRGAWEAWLQSRGVADVDADSCRLQRSGYRLHVGASTALLQQFRAVIRPAVQGDIWLLAGSGRFREAVHVELALSPQPA